MVAVLLCFEMDGPCLAAAAASTMSILGPRTARRFVIVFFLWTAKRQYLFLRKFVLWMLDLYCATALLGVFGRFHFDSCVYSDFSCHVRSCVGHMTQRLERRAFFFSSVPLRDLSATCLLSRVFTTLLGMFFFEASHDLVECTVTTVCGLLFTLWPCDVTGRFFSLI